MPKLRNVDTVASITILVCMCCLPIYQLAQRIIHVHLLGIEVSQATSLDGRPRFNFPHSLARVSNPLVLLESIILWYHLLPSRLLCI